MSGFFIRRPIVAIVISLILVIGGLVMMRTLPVAQFPEIAPTQVQVSALFTGADAVTVEQSVATPIEEQMNGVEDMIYMQSVNGNDGSYTLSVFFEVGTDPNTANVLVQNRLTQAQSRLPASVNAFGLTVRQAFSFPLLVFALYSPKGTYDNRFLGNYATINLTDQLMRVPGVADLRVFGSSAYSMRVWIDPERLANLGLTVARFDPRRATPEHGQSRGATGRRANPARPGVHLHHSRQGPSDHRGGVCRRHRARKSRRLDRPAQGRGAHRARQRELQPDRPLQGAELGGHRGLPATRIERARHRDPHPPGHGSGAEGLPARRGLRRLGRRDLAGVGGHQGDRHHVARGPGPGRDRGLCVPADLARHPDPAAHRAGVAAGGLHHLSSGRLFAEHAVVVRPGAGDWPGGRRRDRGGRSGATPHRGGHGAQRGDPASDA